ncbi:acetylornithine transaminase [Corynebacterium epidermidicanis]|uniref:Acetylornithine aminotransferase n=1 Tax=Corynebacterium epidermidicanis TaxID=1050174 RepID=A0A0G3GVY0_9CORY|nr:acetylornithine transaminase [Corynebacterium epidermidicanis]AKK03032.1 acetylornithine aminotransferase apoenzyme [Corynebacterium epidermidicanis]
MKPDWGNTLMDNYGTPALKLVDAHGCYVVDDQGREHLDLLAGIAVNSLGYGHPALVEAVHRQVASFAHVSNLFQSQPVIDVAAGLIDRFAAGDASLAAETRVFFCNSGAEANEAAFKLARLTGKRRILAAHHGFHGRTMGSLAMTGQPDKRRAFEPLPSGVEFYEYGDIEFLRTLVAQDPTDTAAIILEPIQGETGVIPAPDGFLADVRKLCDEHDILFVVDEVQTGVGRTGTFFAHQHDHVLPDVVTMAKGLGGGLPIGACLAHGRAAGLFGPGSHGTTFGGNPVACAAAKVVLAELDDAFLQQVRRNGELLAERVAQLPTVMQVRGRGLMLGLVLREPVAKQAVAKAAEFGVIINAPAEDVVRLTPPLIISAAEVDLAIERLGRLFEAVS